MRSSTGLSSLNSSLPGYYPGLLSSVNFRSGRRSASITSSLVSPSPHWCILSVFLTPCVSRPHCRVPHPRSILARPHGRQYSLGLQPFLCHQLPQSQECCQRPRLSSAGSTASHHPRRTPSISHSPPRERRLVGIPRRQTRANPYLDHRRRNLHSMGHHRLHLHHR